MNYLISSKSYRLIDDEISNIVKDSNNVSRFDLTFDDLNNILEEAAYFSLFDEKKYLIVRNAEMFTANKMKFDEELLSNYLDNPNPNSIIIFVTLNNIDSRKKITTHFKKNNEIISIKQFTAKEIYTKLEAKIKNEKYKISVDSLYYIINNSLNNYDLAYNTLEKIKLYYGEKKEIKRTDIENMIPINIEDNSFKFVDAVVKCEYKNANKILKDLYLNKVEPFVLINLLFREYKLLLQVKVLNRQKISRTDIMKKLNIQDWMLDKYIKNSFSYSEKELENLIHDLLKLDCKIKSGNIDKKLGLDLFILSI